jgi:CBS domain-containing protein
MTVNQILSAKGNVVYSIISSITVYEALKLMGDQNVGAVLVIEDNVLKGVLSERDYARKIVFKNKASKDILVREIMARDFITVKPTDNLDYCVELMGTKRIRHLPVLLNNAVLGVISIGDIVKSIIEIQKETIQYLDCYINEKKT